MLLLVLSGSLLLGDVSEAAEDAPRLLLLPVVVHSAEDPEYLRDGLSDMLAARFSRIGSIELIRADEDSRGTTSHERALAFGRKAGADFVLFGSFTRFGQGASLDVQCAPVSQDKQREPLREIFVHSGSIGEIIPDLDELAGKVSRFARGEALVPVAADPSVSAGAAASAGGAPLSSPELEELELRIEALEAALTELLDGGTDIIESEAGTDEELR
jgi:TolB-like protein